MTDTSSLRAFIEARLADDEQGARNCLEPDWRPDGARSCEVYVPRDGSNRTIAWCRNGHEDDFANAIHIARHDPARVLREVAAKRARIELAEQIGAERGHPFWPYAGEQLLKLEAASWSDHPDFRTEWSTA